MKNLKKHMIENLFVVVYNYGNRQWLIEKPHDLKGVI